MKGGHLIEMRVREQKEREYIEPLGQILSVVSELSCVYPWRLNILFSFSLFLGW